MTDSGPNGSDRTTRKRKSGPWNQQKQPPDSSGSGYHHPKRRRGETPHSWSERCATAHEKRLAVWTRFFGEGGADHTEDLEQCIEFHDHPVPPPQWCGHGALLTRYPRSGGADRHLCLTCNPPSGPEYVIFDTECTGTSRSDVVIQIGAVLCDAKGLELAAYEELWRTNRPSNPFALKVHNIPDAKVRSSPVVPRDGLVRFFHLLKRVQTSGGTVVAHNANFDLRMVRQTLQLLAENSPGERVPFPLEEGPLVFCTARALRKRSEAERGPNCKNASVYNFLGGPPLIGRLHTALTDARATSFVFFTGKKKSWW